MCVAAPGIVREINGNMAKIDYDGNIVQAHTGIVDVKPGDYVLVHAGMILQKLMQREAEEMQQLLNELENI